MARLFFKKSGRTGILFMTDIKGSSMEVEPYKIIVTSNFSMENMLNGPFSFLYKGDLLRYT